MNRQIKIIFAFVTFLAISLRSQSQKLKQSDFLGKWHYQKMYLDTVCVSDINDSTVLINYTMAQSKKMKPNFSSKDSMNIIDNCRKRTMGMETVFIEFLKDGSYNNTEIKSGGRGVTENIEHGKYKFNKKKQIIEFESIQKMNARLSNGHLFMDFYTNDKKITFEYIRK